MGIESSSDLHDQHSKQAKDFKSNWDLKLDPAKTSAFVNRLQLKALAAGQISAAIERTCELEGAAQDEAVLQLSEEMVAKLKSFMAEHSRDPAAQV